MSLSKHADRFSGHYAIEIRVTALGTLVFGKRECLPPMPNPASAVANKPIHTKRGDGLKPAPIESSAVGLISLPAGQGMSALIACVAMASTQLAWGPRQGKILSVLELNLPPGLKLEANPLDAVLRMCVDCCWNSVSRKYNVSLPIRRVEDFIVEPLPPTTLFTNPEQPGVRLNLGLPPELAREITGFAKATWQELMGDIVLLGVGPFLDQHDHYPPVIGGGPFEIKQPQLTRWRSGGKLICVKRPEPADRSNQMEHSKLNRWLPLWKLIGVNSQRRAQSEQLGAHIFLQPPPPFCDSPLHWVVRGGNLPKVKVLLRDNPGLVFSKDANGDTPLHMAASYGHRGVAELLLASKAEVNTRNEYGATPLYMAVLYGHNKVAELLLANNADVNAKTKNGLTPLHIGAKNSDKLVLPLLLANGADVHATNNKGKTPLQLVEKSDHAGVAQLLRAKGAVLSIHDASSDGDLEGVKSILENSPDLVFSKDHSGEIHPFFKPLGYLATPLHYAALNGHKHVAELLLANKAEVDAKDAHGHTPLHNAASNGHKDVVELLLSHKADINAKTERQKFMALHLAAIGGHKDVAVLLLAKNAEVNARDAFGHTALHKAASSGREDLAESLLANNAEVNFEDGLTPLNLAASHGHRNLVELLLLNKADVDGAKQGVVTPLYGAAWGGHEPVVQLLLAYKADVNAKTVNGLTPLRAATSRGHISVAALLRQHGGHE